MGCCCTRLAILNGIDSFPIIKNTEAKTGRLDPKQEEREGFLSNMISEAYADRKPLNMPSLVLLLFNPYSGNGLGKVNSKKLEKLLNENGVEVIAVDSKSPGHLTEISNMWNFREYDCVALCGGDGTISEFLQGVIDRKLQIPIALCPGGTGNSLAFSLGLKTPEDCFDSIMSNSHIGVDSNRVVDADGMTFYSINMIGGALAYDANARAEKLRHCGPIRYDMSALSLFCQSYSRPLEMDVEGHKLSCKSLAFFLMNNTSMGAGSHCSPFASITDGYFDMWVVPNMNLTKGLKVLGALKDGSHMYMPEAKYTLLRAKKMKYFSSGGINIDGENCAEGPCVVECMKSSWRLMYKIPEKEEL